MKDKTKKVQIVFKLANNEKIIIDSLYPSSLDTVSFKLAIPANLANTLDKWMDCAIVNGDLPEGMTSKDVLISQALSGFLLSMAQG